MKRVYIFAIALVVFASLPTSADIIHIPGDYPTIQEGINASSDGDTVLVQPGTYVENINFNGHNIVVGSLFLTTGDTTYIEQTVIDGDSSGTVITFENQENYTTKIIGFTIQNGRWPIGVGGGGILCINQSDPIIGHNIIKENRSSQGGGIRCVSSNPVIEGNIIRNNFSNTEGGGIWIDHSNTVIYGNTITGNSGCCGGGIFCFSDSNIVIGNNVIYGNSVDYYGGGINCLNSYPVIVNNTISENTARYGGGILCQNQSEIEIINTIFWGNEALNGGNELHIFNGSINALFCDVQGGWEGEGNIDVDPLFRDPENGDFHLMADSCGDVNNSPCIDAGDPAIFDSMHGCDWGLEELRSDMGAYGGGDSVTVGFDDYSNLIPKRLALMQNYPNPFNSSTVIKYDLPQSSHVTIAIYNILGRRVETLVQGEQLAGYHQITWDASGHSTGIYFYRIQAGEYAETRKMVLLK